VWIVFDPRKRKIKEFKKSQGEEEKSFIKSNRNLNCNLIEPKRRKTLVKIKLRTEKDSNPLKKMK